MHNLLPYGAGLTMRRGEREDEEELHERRSAPLPPCMRALSSCTRLEKCESRAAVGAHHRSMPAATGAAALCGEEQGRAGPTARPRTPFGIGQPAHEECGE